MISPVFDLLPPELTDIIVKRDDVLYQPRRLYNTLEIEALRTSFPEAEDAGLIDAILDDEGLSRWFFDRDIRVYSQKRIIYGMLQKRENELISTMELRKTIDSKPSKEVILSPLARRRY